MFLKYALLAVLGGSLVWGCGGGGAGAPSEPIGSEEPLPDRQPPSSNSQDPRLNAQDPEIGAQEPRPDPQAPQGPQIGGEGGASPGDP